MEILLNHQGTLEKVNNISNSKNAIEISNIEIDGGDRSEVADFVEIYGELCKAINSYKLLLQKDISNTQNAIAQYTTLDQKLGLGFTSSMEMSKNK